MKTGTDWPVMSATRQLFPNPITEGLPVIRPESETSQVEPLAQVIVVGNRMGKTSADSALDIILRRT